jgi:hypothetical protein
MAIWIERNTNLLNVPNKQVLVVLNIKSKLRHFPNTRLYFGCATSGSGLKKCLFCPIL